MTVGCKNTIELTLLSHFYVLKTSHLVGFQSYVCVVVCMSVMLQSGPENLVCSFNRLIQQLTRWLAP